MKGEKNMALKGRKKGNQEDFRFEIVTPLGVISTNDNSGWNTEVNVVSWNGREPKIDIRAWSPDHKHMSKGVALTEEEALKVVEFIKSAID